MDDIFPFTPRLWSPRSTPPHNRQHMETTVHKVTENISTSTEKVCGCPTLFNSKDPSTEKPFCRAKQANEIRNGCRLRFVPGDPLAHDDVTWPVLNPKHTGQGRNEKLPADSFEEEDNILLGDGATLPHPDDVDT